MSKITIVLAGTLLFLSANPALAQYYYADLLNPPRQFIIYEDRIAAGGKPMPAKFCPTTSDYICFSSGGVKFAVPKTIADKRSWVFEGAAYKLKRREKFGVLGEAVDTIFIEQTFKNDVTNFLFSEERGLLGFSLVGNVPRFFLLENRCGFGAIASCSETLREAGR